MSTETDDTAPPCYDVVVVGAGMIGSSAASHASKLTHNGQRLTVCLIGPDEPLNRSGNRTIFGAHYDEGRITRVLASDSLWAELAKKSIMRYRQLEQETGIHFYEEVGCLTITDNIQDWIAKSTEPTYSLEDQGLLRLSGDELAVKFPYLASRPACTNRPTIVDGSTTAILETKDSGYINPRRFCLAQQTAARSRGCHVIRDVVSDVIDDGARNEQMTLKVITDSGLTVRARKVLIATGAFTQFRRLLPPDVRPVLRYLTQSVIFAELTQTDVDCMRRMPSTIVMKRLIGNNPDDEGTDFQCYILPPITYPDGKTYLKLGHGHGGQLERPLNTPEDIMHWYRNSVPEHDQQILATLLRTVFPDLKPVSVHCDNCVTSHTPSGRPYIDLLTPSLGVALGGNGYAAKSSDEIGRLAADLLVTGTWSDPNIPHEAVHIIRAPLNADTTSKL